MFVRFTKCGYKFYKDTKKFVKGAKIGDTAFMEIDEDVIATAKVVKKTDKSIHYNVVVAGKNPYMNATTISRAIKRLVGNSRKFEISPSTLRRFYKVTIKDVEILPVKARLTIQSR